MTGRPTPPPFQQPPFYVRYRKGIITAVVVLILAVAAAVAFHFYGSRSSGDYVKDAVSLSQQLSSENESVTDTAKRLSQIRAKATTSIPWLGSGQEPQERGKRWPRIISPRTFPTSMHPMTRPSAKSCAIIWPCMIRP